MQTEKNCLNAVKNLRNLMMKDMILRMRTAMDVAAKIANVFVA
jgi:hypothetical protein